ncbi:MAG TPA: VTT domain-containing protein [Gemmata sp.]|nr:VTT domain-containing protein [Gemmata sp.]
MEEISQFFAQFWNLFVTFINPLNLVHPERYVEALRAEGTLAPSLVAVSAIVFAETGLLIGFLLPGDSMLVVVGIFIGVAGWSLPLFVVVLSLCAIVGDSVGYMIGKQWGPGLFSRPDGRIFKQKYLQRAKAFYEKHGGKTIIIARFIPIIRTFAPAVAGAVRMNYRTFLFYNVVGGIGWIASMLLIGYLLDPLLRQLIGPEFQIAKHIDKVILVVVMLSVSPMIWKWWQHRRAGETPAEAAIETAAGVDPEVPAADPAAAPGTAPPG